MKDNVKYYLGKERRKESSFAFTIKKQQQINKRHKKKETYNEGGRRK